jgi:hypothetical protein
VIEKSEDFVRKQGNIRSKRKKFIDWLLKLGSLTVAGSLKEGGKILIA